MEERKDRDTLKRELREAIINLATGAVRCGLQEDDVIDIVNSLADQFESEGLYT